MECVAGTAAITADAAINTRMTFDMYSSQQSADEVAAYDSFDLSPEHKEDADADECRAGVSAQTLGGCTRGGEQQHTDDVSRRCSPPPASAPALSRLPPRAC